MDTRTLKEQLHEVQAQLNQAKSSVVTAQSALSQRKVNNLQPKPSFANVLQSLMLHKKRLNRSCISKTNAISIQQLDDDIAEQKAQERRLKPLKLKKPQLLLQ